MSNINKVVWSEGMFLRPQHFQQQERYIESYIHRGIATYEGFYWGFSHLVIDAAALGLGTILVRQAKGLMPDGTPFDFIADEIPPLALDVPATVKDAKVCLVLPPQREGAESVIYDENAASTARFRAVTFEAGDSNELGAEVAEIQVGQPRFRLMLEADVPDAWMAMGMARVSERQANNALRMDQSYIPPTLNCGGQEVLSSYIKEVMTLLAQRGDALAQRLSAGGRGGVSEVGEFLVLTLINRWQPLMQHFAKIMLHPERFYEHLICLAGELTSFSAADRRVKELLPYPYIHDDLRATFTPLMSDLRQALALVLDQTVVRIDLREHPRFGIRMAIVPDRTLFKRASFVLAVSASLPAEAILAQFPSQAKIGPVEKIRDLINLHLPGVGLRSLPVAPRELPFNAGASYFEMDTQHELWKEMDKSAAMALHIAGEFPGLALECWAIRK